MSSAISPKANLAANAGIGKIVGRCSTRPSVLVNSRFVTGVGRGCVHRPDERGGRECELNDAHEIVERDPTHVLLAAADDAAEHRAGTA